MRISCPPILFDCPFINFSESKSVTELITRRIIAELEGEQAALDDERVKAYSVTGSPEYQRMIDALTKHFGLQSLRFTSLENLVRAIGLPGTHICTHCFNCSSCHTLQ